MGLPRRLALLALIIVVILGGFAVASVSVATSRSRASRSEVASSVSAKRLLQLRSSYGDMETGQRGFIIGGSEAFLEPYEIGEKNVDLLQASLLLTLRQNSPRSVPQLKAVIAKGNFWRARATEEISARRTKGRAAAEALIGEQVSKARFDGLRAQLDLMSTKLDREQAVNRAERERRARQLASLIIAMPVAVIAFLGVCAALINRWVLAPIRAIIRAVNEISSGNLTTVVPSHGAPDIAELGTRVDAMRLSIVGRLQEAADARTAGDQAREAIEQNTILALQVRAELASELGIMPVGWTAAADLLPAEGWVAGDCYDVTLISPHEMGIIVVDIAGHGAQAAIMALRAKEVLRAALRVPLQPGEALALLAEQVGDLAPSFLTEEFEIPPGGKLAVYTDGLNEARNASDEFYGMERLAALVIGLPCKEASPVIKACFDDLQLFSPARLTDDVTMVLICRACPE